jgi:hypothetical protein
MLQLQPQAKCRERFSAVPQCCPGYPISLPGYSISLRKLASPTPLYRVLQEAGDLGMPDEGLARFIAISEILIVLGGLLLAVLLSRILAGRLGWRRAKLLLATLALGGIGVRRRRTDRDCDVL